MSEEKRATLPSKTPRSWHGMTAKVWFNLLWRNRFAISPSRLPMAFAISIASGFNSSLRAVSELTYGKHADELEIELPPLFVIGHWRTGTTWLHELLVKDERFAFPTTYQCMAPHHFLLTHRLFSRWLDWFLPSRRPMDDMQVGMLRPQEDEFALMNLGLASPYLDWAFPNRNQEWDDYLTLENLEPSDREEWKRQFVWFVRRLTAVTPKRLILKSPAHTARVGTLLEVFPNARFVHVVRNPLQAIPSTVRTWTRMSDVLSLQVRRQPISEDRVLDVFQQMYGQFNKDRALIPDEHFYAVRYEDLVADPVGEIEQIYRHLQLGDFEPARAPLETYLESIADYRPNQLGISDELRRKTTARCLEYMEQYGYGDAVLAEAAR